MEERKYEGWQEGRKKWWEGRRDGDVKGRTEGRKIRKVGKKAEGRAGRRGKEGRDIKSQTAH